MTPQGHDTHTHTEHMRVKFCIPLLRRAAWSPRAKAERIHHHLSGSHVSSTEAQGHTCWGDSASLVTWVAGVPVTRGRTSLLPVCTAQQPASYFTVRVFFFFAAYSSSEPSSKSSKSSSSSEAITFFAGFLAAGALPLPLPPPLPLVAAAASAVRG